MRKYTRHLLLAPYLMITHLDIVLEIIVGIPYIVFVSCDPFFSSNLYLSLALMVIVYTVIHFAFSNTSSLEVRNVYRELETVDRMDGYSFEKYVAEILSQYGYSRIKVTKASGDFGADIIASKGKDKYAIQCKNYSGKVGPHAVQEIYAAKEHYKTDLATVITNSFFTKGAYTLAKETGVLLWDREALAEIIDEIRISPQEKKKREIIYAVKVGLKVFLIGFGLATIIIRLTYGNLRVAGQNDINLTRNLVNTTEKKEDDFLEPLPTPYHLTVEQQNTEVSDVDYYDYKKDEKIILTPISTPNYQMAEQQMTESPIAENDDHQIDRENVYYGIMRKSANIREKDSVESKIVGKALEGERVQIIKPFFNEKWHQVLYNGMICYISANYCIIQE